MFMFRMTTAPFGQLLQIRVSRKLSQEQIPHRIKEQQHGTAKRQDD